MVDVLVLVAKLVVPTSTTCVTSVDLELFGFFTTHDNDIVFGHAFLVNHATETTIILLQQLCNTNTPHFDDLPKSFDWLSVQSSWSVRWYCHLLTWA